MPGGGGGGKGGRGTGASKSGKLSAMRSRATQSRAFSRKVGGGRG